MIKIIALLLLLPQIALAQSTVTIRSGEHDGFTRLVLTVDPEIDWELSESRGEISLAFPLQSFEFLTDSIFDRIPKTRLTAAAGRVSEFGSSLVLEIPCECAAKVYRFGAQYIVMDIQDGGPLRDLEFVTREMPPPAFAFWEPEMLPDPPAEGLTDFYKAVVSAAISEPEAMGDDPPLMGAENFIDAEMLQVTADPDPEMVERIAEAQSQLLQQLTRAADQGLIEFVPTDPIVPEVDQMDIDIVQETVAPLQIESPQVLLRQLNARTAYDDASSAELAEIVNDFAQPQCLDDSEFDVGSWRTEQGFTAQLAEFRAKIYGEFDIVKKEAVLDLAKLYIGYGLGAEAEAILSQLSGDPAKTALLVDLARIVDGRPWPKGGPVSLGAGCGGNHEMWFLSGGTARQSLLETDSVTQAFARYPIDVRLLIGPALADAFLDAGQLDAANLVLETVRRAAVSDSTVIDLSAAKILESQDQFEDANILFQDVANDQSKDSAEAVISLARLALASEDAVNPALLVDLADIAFSQRDTPIGAEARLWEIRVSAQLAGMSEALAKISDDLADENGEADALISVLSEIYEKYTTLSEGPFAYAEAVFDYISLLPDDADDARLQIGREMITLGLPGETLNVLMPLLARDDNRAKIIIAQAHLAMFDTGLALAALEGLDSDQARRLTLAAYLQDEDDSAIQTFFSDPKNVEFVNSESAWRAGDWQNIGDEAPLAALAEFMRGDVTPIIGNESDLPERDAFLMALQNSEEPNLAAAQNLLRVNRASRSYLETILAEN